MLFCHPRSRGTMRRAGPLFGPALRSVATTRSRHMRDIAIIGTPVDLGAGRRGVDMGPSAIRYAGLKERLEALGHRVRDLGNIHVPLVEQIALPVDGEKLRYLD